MLADHVPGGRSAKLCGQNVFLIAFSQQMGTYPPRQGWPADEPKDDGDEEKPFFGAPRIRTERGQRHEQGDGGDGADGIGHHLNERVDPTPVVSGYPTYNQSQHKGDKDTDRADRKRCVDGVEGAREDVLAR